MSNNPGRRRKSTILCSTGCSMRPFGFWSSSSTCSTWRPTCGLPASWAICSGSSTGGAGSGPWRTCGRASRTSRRSGSCRPAGAVSSSLVMLTIDILFTPRLVRKHNWRQYSRFRNAERVKWMMQEHKGLLMVTGHYSNFEITGYMMGLFGFDIYSDRPSAGQQVPQSVPVQRAGAAGPEAHRQEGGRRDDAQPRASRAARSVSSPIRTPATRASSSISSAARPAPTRASACWPSRTTCPS